MSTTDWPKKIVVCLECGAVSGNGWWFSWTTHCKDGGFHGPTQTVEVVPAPGQDAE